MPKVLSPLLIVLRLALGALFLFSGLNDLLHFWQPPAPTTPEAEAFMHGLVASGFMLPLQGVVFAASGLALLSGRYVALALAALAAPVVVIFGYHAFMQGHWASPGLAVLAVYLVLVWQQRTTLGVLFRTRPVEEEGINRADGYAR
jgi:uncharacterized membrane protein YphA (DoxX/SURF4 family)